MDIDGIFDRVVSHAKGLGIFDRVNGHEPKNAPGNGTSAAIWADRITPIRSSGLASVSVRMAFNIRIYVPMLSEPQDDIDPAILRATDQLLAAYCGDFRLDHPEVRSIDIFGAHGPGLDARAGYVDQDSNRYRVMVVTLPVIVNDAWTEAT